jgi:hypothetical protein
MENTSHVPLSRPWLESLSTAELIKLADSYGIDIPPELERIFIIEELLENSFVDVQEPEDGLKTGPALLEAVALPKQYNISYIEVLIRDPLWVFAFWEIKSHDREMHENAADFNGYCLRVIPVNERGEAIPKSKEETYTVAVSADDSARYLGFTEQSQQAAGRYIIKLGVLRGSTELPIAVSLPFNLPRLTESEGICDLNQNPLIRLSGVRDFSTIKSTDRQSRAKRQ